ncbi:class I SAM-dependent methyltransferase [Mucilaginibacter glaciei]|uniref:Methyltransferase domain-containing protein n=1 Tax=Mucilaginibacter glaciei TaxID=2772109 RepID=A0A926NT33_9SPHI|nr:hypothetical protein [Mucilaginibacter glaciei]MBD1393465.1 hypothetical protein [Mucilaginibacter glaciei]
MNIYKYLKRQLRRLKIDLTTQGKFLAGQIPSIDSDNLIKTVSSNYEELQIVFFERYQIKPDDVIYDVGCGKARVFSYLLYKGVKNKMIGYEINPVVGKETKKRLAKYKNVEIRLDNIFDDFPTTGNVFYLYNPFKEEMVKEFTKRILALKHLNPVIFYNNPVHLHIFDQDTFDIQFEEIAVKEFNYTFPFALIRIKQK